MEYFLVNKRYLKHDDIVLVEIKSLLELRDAALNTFLGNTEIPNWVWIKNETFNKLEGEKQYADSVRNHDIFVAFTVANKFLITVIKPEYMQKMDVWIPPISIKDIDGYDVNTKEKGPQGNRATYYHLRDLVLEFKRKYHTKL